MQHLARLGKRLAVLLPGLVVTYFAVSDFYPAIEKQVPAALASLLTYMVVAYVVIPALMRLIRIIIKPKHIPLYCTTPDGFASDPVNVGVVGTREQLIAAMTKAGWYQADQRTFRTLFRLGLSMVLSKPYPKAPFSNLYLFGRSQDIGFELPLDNNPRHRHHVRFWAAKSTSKDSQHQEHAFFWQKQHPRLSGERALWVGAASLDVGLGIIRHNAQLTHMIHPDTNAERDLIVSQLEKAGVVTKKRSVTVGSPYQLVNRVWSGYMNADGKMTICELKLNF